MIRKYPIDVMTIELKASDDELRDNFFDLSTPEDVANLLELNSYAFLEYILFVNSSNRYTKFKIPKKRGGFRTIHEPSSNLKIIQHKLLHVLQLVYEPKPAVHGFVPERSIVTNASKHTESKYVLNLDIKNFFPSINFGRVRGMFMAYPYYFNAKVATVLAQICSLQTGLPQGAPTSPIISNMICAKLDSQLQRLAKNHRCYYTRYADDITFSTTVQNFPTALAILVTDENGLHIEIGNDLEKIILSNGFKINSNKVRLQTKNKRQEVTGLTTNEFVNVNRKFIRQVRAMLHAWEKYGYDAAEKEYQDKHNHKKYDKSFKNFPSFQKVVKGKIEFVGMVRGRTDNIFIRFNNKAGQLERDSGLKTNLFDLIVDPDDYIMSLIAGGETDLVEFKIGACLDPYTGQEKKKEMSQKILEEVAAFMNTYPEGNLIIGVANDHTVVGIEREYKVADKQKANWDGYKLFLTNVLKDSLSLSNPFDFCKISRHKINGKIVCSIKMTKANKPVLANNKLFIRIGDQCNELKGEDKVDYVMNWV